MRNPLCSTEGLRRGIFYTLAAIALASSQSFPQNPLQPVGSLDSTAFNQVRMNGKYSFIEFGGRHCVPCRRMQPTLAELNDAYGQTMNVFNVFMDPPTGLFRKYRIMLIPTQIIFDTSGNEIARHVGYWDEEELLAELKRLQVIR